MPLQDSYLVDTFNQCNYHDITIQFDSFEEFIDAATSQQIETFMTYHPCRNSLLKSHRLIYQNDYDRLNWAGRVLYETQNILRNFRPRNYNSNEVVKVVNNIYQHMYIITLSPTPTLINVIDKVVKVVKSVNNNCKFLYGVFELGNKSGGFHTHYIVQYDDKHKAQAFYRKIEKLNSESYWIRLHKEPINNKVQLIMNIRYLSKHDKINRGYFQNGESYDHLISLTDFQDSIPENFEEIKL